MQETSVSAWLREWLEPWFKRIVVSALIVVWMHYYNHPVDTVSTSPQAPTVRAPLIYTEIPNDLELKEEEEVVVVVVEEENRTAAVVGTAATALAPSSSSSSALQQGDTNEIDNTIETSDSAVVIVELDEDSQQSSPSHTNSSSEWTPVERPSEKADEQQQVECNASIGDATLKDHSKDLEDSVAHAKTTITTILHTESLSERTAARQSDHQAICEEQVAFVSTTSEHPGLTGFHHWMDIESSLYRLYTISTKEHPAIPPYNPSSRRGTVRVFLHITNRMYCAVNVYWVDYKGKEEPKGRIAPLGNGAWTQTTWIDHPWVFRDATTDEVLFYYIPYRVIPTTEAVPTVDPTDPEVGMHQFTILPALYDDERKCLIQDHVMPFPAADYFTNSTVAIDWTMQHCQRLEYHDSDWQVLLKYLTNIILHPEDPKYRRIRIANKAFYNSVWNSPARGVLLAMGFVEQGAYCELGCDREALPRERVQEVSTTVFRIEQYLFQLGNNDNPWQGQGPQQPVGADGYGRAGFGRAGAIN